MTNDPLEILLAENAHLARELEVKDRMCDTLAHEVARLRRQLHISLQLNEELIDIGRELLDGPG